MWLFICEADPWRSEGTDDFHTVVSVPALCRRLSRSPRPQRHCAAAALYWIVCHPSMIYNRLYYIIIQRLDGTHTLSIAFRHLPPKEGCRKPAFGVWIVPSVCLLYRHCIVATVYCGTDNALYPLSTVQTMHHTLCVVYRQCIVASVYRIDNASYPLPTVQTMHHTLYLLYRQCIVPSPYCTDNASYHLPTVQTIHRTLYLLCRRCIVTSVYCTDTASLPLSTGSLCHPSMI